MRWRISYWRGRDPATVFESGGLVEELKKRLAERMLDGEMEHHLDAEVAAQAGNHCNGYSSKTVLTDSGKLEAFNSARSSRTL